MSRVTIIISGGAIEDDFALSVLESYESKRIIGVDKGVEFLYRHQILPEYIVGDFDSISEEVIRYYREETKVPIRQYNPVKDASDTEIAIRTALALGCDQMIILGATGSRIDHIWANVQSLEIARKAGVHAEIRDTCNRIRLCDGEVRLKRREAFGKYFSLFPFGGEVENLTLVGAKYPLDHHHLLPNDSLCVSNEIEEDELVITFSSGTLILMETKDE